VTDANRLEFIVQPELLPELARRCGLNPGPLSMIMREPPGTTAPVGADQMLRVEGLIDDQGRVIERYCKEVATLANPNSRVRIYVIQNSAVLDFSSILGEDGSKLSYTVTDRGLVFRFPSDDAAILHWLSGVMGNSPFVQTPLAVTLPAGEAMILAAAIDLQRNDLLMSVIENHMRPVIMFKSADIAKELHASSNQATMFVSLVRGAMEYEDPISDVEIQGFLSTLSTRGHIGSTGPGQYSLSNPFFLLARQLKVFSTVLRVSYAGIDTRQ